MGLGIGLLERISIVIFGWLSVEAFATLDGEVDRRFIGRA